tara:strand:- start:122 stop:349 length:228 start_codon:yes stop_codon:yes gene_type:complete
MSEQYRQEWNFKLLDERCPNCDVKKYHYNWLEDYYLCLFCNFKKKGEVFFDPNHCEHQEDYCFETDDFINNINES